MVGTSYNKESLLGNTRRPDVSFFRDGRIDITSRVARSLGIADGDVVDVIKYGQELYLYIRLRGTDVVGKHTAQCHLSKPNTGYSYYRAFSVKLCRSILSLMGNVTVARLAAGDRMELDGVAVVPLITRINLNNNDTGD